MARTPSRKNRRRGRGWAWTLTLTAALLAVVWVGSMPWGVVARNSAGHVLGIVGGQIIFVRHGNPPKWPTIQGLTFEIQGNSDWDLEWWFGRIRYGYGQANSIWFAPLWPFILLTAGPGVWMLIKTRRHTNPNACPACGYDRTGLPQSSTGPAACPECGPECGKT